MAKQGRYIYDWPRPMVTVDMIVFSVVADDTRVLLIKRGNEPFRGQWAFPGGFVEMDEELIDAAGRELAEETGLCGVELEQMHTFGGIGRDPRGRLISVAFVGILNNRPTPEAGDDAAEAKWFDIANLPKMAFDHAKIAEMAIDRLR